MNWRVVAICGVLTASLGISIATAAPAATTADRSFTWTEAKAARIVVRDARVQLASSERASLEQELLRSVGLFQALGLGAEDVGDMRGAARYHGIATRYSDTLRDVRGGLGIDTAQCNGSGPGASGSRFNRFVCSAASELLDIPSVTLVPETDGGMPTVVEGQARTLGPVQARFSVRVTGRSTIGYRQIVVE